jgi:uncharacterized protein YkwD
MTSNTDPAVQHNLDQLNMYRAQNSAPPLQLTDALDTFATAGSQELAADNMPHAHFKNAGDAIWQSGFCSGAGENQAPNWPIGAGGVDGAIDTILDAMMKEGPGGGHHDNIVNPDFRLVGVGLVMQGGLFLTNDFSNACP